MVFRENLKIGDKVRGINPASLPFFVGRDFTVVEVMPEESLFACRVSGDSWENVLVYSQEIEKISKYAPNEQLLFLFME